MEFLYDIFMPAIATIITGLITWGLSAAVNWIKTKIKNENVNAALVNVRDIITAAVAETSQIFVDDLKKNGEFTDALKIEAYEMTLKRVCDQLTDEAAELIKSTTNDFDAWIAAEIEKAVAEGKKGAK